jgi:hypothetical protein
MASNTKTVYAFDSETKHYIGVVELGEADLSPEEEGVWLVPGNCLEKAPPVFDPERFACLVTGNEWALELLPLPEPPAQPTLEDRIATLQSAVDAHLNAAARARRYDSIHTAALRAGYPGPFHVEGLAFATWMDAVYAKCYEVLAMFTAGEISEPSCAQLIALLPGLNFPESKGG